MRRKSPCSSAFAPFVSGCHFWSSDAILASAFLPSAFQVLKKRGPCRQFDSQHAGRGHTIQGESCKDCQHSQWYRTVLEYLQPGCARYQPSITASLSPSRWDGVPVLWWLTILCALQCSTKTRCHATYLCWDLIDRLAYPTYFRNQS